MICHMNVDSNKLFGFLTLESKLLNETRRCSLYRKITKKINSQIRTHSSTERRLSSISLDVRLVVLHEGLTNCKLQ